MLLKSVRDQLPPTDGVLLDNLERIISELEENSRLTSLLDLSECGELLFTAYIAFAVAVYTEKFKQLYGSIADSLNHRRYLLYAQSGRSILENAATIRYYARHKDLIALREAKRQGSIPKPTLDAAITAVDRLIRGNRFSWDAFISGKFGELSKVPSGPQQVHVQACLDNWYKESPPIEGLYHLMCDLVHPNLGSNLTVIRTHEGKFAACGDIGGYNYIMCIVIPTLAALVGTYRVIQESLMALEALKIDRNHS